MMQQKEHPIGCSFVAEKVGFEPTHRLPQSTPLAGEPLIATWVLLRIKFSMLAEREGFEPPVPFSITSFQDWLHKPLGHLSKNAPYEV